MFLALAWLCPLAGQEEKPDLSVMINRLGADDFRTREGATERLLKISELHFDAVAEALLQAGRSDDPEMNMRLSQSMRALFDYRVLGKGRRDLGLSWKWLMIVPRQGKIIGRPLAFQVDEGSPAAEEWLGSGDHYSASSIRRRR